MSEAIKTKTCYVPWLNCPPCPRCKHNIAIVTDECRISERLMCPACGIGFHGTDAEYEQAITADQAWHDELRRQERN